MSRAQKIQVFDSKQFEQDFKNITDPALRRRLIRQLHAFTTEVQRDSQPASSREDSEIAGWAGFHFAYLEKPYGLVYKLEGENLYLGRIAPDGEILLF